MNHKRLLLSPEFIIEVLKLVNSTDEFGISFGGIPDDISSVGGPIIELAVQSAKFDSEGGDLAVTVRQEQAEEFTGPLRRYMREDLDL